MEKKKDDYSLQSRLITCSIVVLFDTAAFSCSLTAEFNRVEVKDMKLDGTLCSLPSSPAFGLGIAGLACMSVAQIIGTIGGGARLCTDNKFDITNNRKSLVYLITSWEEHDYLVVCPSTVSLMLCYGLAAVMLGTGASMNSRQPYGKGWMDGDCYVVKNGVFGGAAAVAIIAGILIIGFASSCLQLGANRSTGAGIAVAVQGRHKQGQ